MPSDGEVIETADNAICDIPPQPLIAVREQEVMANSDFQLAGLSETHERLALFVPDAHRLLKQHVDVCCEDGLGCLKMMIGWKQNVN